MPKSLNMVEKFEWSQKNDYSMASLQKHDIAV